jgi:hypothetical protein
LFSPQPTNFHVGLAVYSAKETVSSNRDHGGFSC